MKFYIVSAVDTNFETFSAGGDMTTEDIEQAALFRVKLCAVYEAENQTFYHRESGLRFKVKEANLYD